MMRRRGRMSASEKEVKKSQAKSLFIKDFSIQSISDITEVGIKTLSNWRKEFRWDEEKDLHSMKPSTIRNLTVKCAVAIEQGKPLPYSADQISKIVAAFDKVTDAKKTIVYTSESFTAFTNHMIEKAGTVTGQKRIEILEFLQEYEVHHNQYLTKLIQDD